MQFALALVSLLALAPHANSISASRIEVAGGRVVLELEMQTLSLLEVLPELDPNSDLFLDEAELEAAKPAIADYVGRHYVLRAGSADGLRLEGTLADLVETTPDTALAFASQRVLATFVCAVEAPPPGLFVEVSLFEDTSPGHRDFATLVWEGQPELEWLFHADAPVLAFTPDRDRPAELRAKFFARGARAVLAFELWGFALALALASRSTRSALRVGLLWSGAVALALLVGSAVPSLPARLLALAAALATPYTAAESALGRTPRATAVEAVLFGIVGGLALEPELGAALAGEPLAASARAAHVLGLAAALFALAAVGALFKAPFHSGAASGLTSAGRRLARIGSATLAIVGLYRFARLAWFAS